MTEAMADVEGLFAAWGLVWTVQRAHLLRDLLDHEQAVCFSFQLHLGSDLAPASMAGVARRLGRGQGPASGGRW